MSNMSRPTRPGPLHMGHCRGAVVGDSLARLLEAAGFRVTKEYYVNDAGAQVDTLARSVHLRYREALGEDIGEIPEGMYPGDYLVPVGVLLAGRIWRRFRRRARGSLAAACSANAAITAMLDLIRHDLALLGIHHDIFASEAELQESGAVDRAMAELLRDRTWSTKASSSGPRASTRTTSGSRSTLTLFRSSQFGDDQDRPMKKSDGSWTYFGADAAYHFEKSRNADHLINIWGADHAGTVKRVQSAVKALTDGRVDLDVKLVNMVRLFRAGEPVKMSQARGRLHHAGRGGRGSRQGRRPLHHADPRADAPLDFDFAKVVEASKDNPVFYVQYAHARISSLKRKAADAGVDLGGEGRPRPCSMPRSSRWSARPRNIRASSKVRPWPTSRTASLSISMSWRRNSMPCGIAATTIRAAASWSKAIHNFLARGWNWRSASGKSSRAACHHGRDRDRGDALTMDESRAITGLDRLPWLADEREAPAPRAHRSPGRSPSRC